MSNNMDDTNYDFLDTGNTDNVEDYSDNPNIQQVSQVFTKSPSLSFNQPIIEGQEEKPKFTGKRFISKVIFIDKLNQKRIRIELTPSVCETCAFDVSEKVFGNWNRTPTDQRLILQKALEEHKRVVHTLADSYIIDESQIPTKWLGNSRSSIF